MPARLHLKRILGDESLTRGLRDSEARILVEWLADQTEITCEMASTRVEDTDHFLFMVQLYTPEGVSFHHDLVGVWGPPKSVAELWGVIVDEVEALYETHCR